MRQDTSVWLLFGKRLRMARHRANLSQDELAKRLQVGQDTISHYEQGKFMPSYITLVHLAHILRIDVTYFFPDNTYSQLKVEERETVALLSSLPPAAREYVLTFMQYFVQYQHRQHFLTEHLQHPSELHSRLLSLLERDAKILEEQFIAKKGQVSLTPTQILVSLTSLLLMGMSLEVKDDQREDLIRRLAHTSQHLTHLVKELLITEQLRIRS